MAVVIGAVGRDEFVLELEPFRTVTHKGYAKTFPTYEDAVKQVFEAEDGPLLDETKWGIEER